MTDARPSEMPTFSPHGLGMVPALVWAFHFHPDGSAEPLDIEAPLACDGWVWLHLNLSDTRAMEWIAASPLPQFARDAFRHHGSHQQLHAMDACVAGVVSDLAQKFDGTDDSVKHFHFAMTERLLISGRHHPLAGAARTRDALEKGQVRLNRVAALFELIVDKLAEGIDHYVSDLSEGLDAIEEQLARGGRPESRGELGRVRRTSVKIHRELSGLRMVLWRLDEETVETLPHELRIGAGRLTQRLDAIDRAVVDLRDRARLLQEEINAAVAEESNRSLNVLSIITAFFLPATLVSGIFGMNTKGLPFGEDPDGSLYAFGLMGLSVIAVVLVLRRVGVLGRPAA